MRAITRLRRLLLAVGIIFALGLGTAGGVMLQKGFEAHNEVSQQLAQEHITFPKAGSEGITALPAADAAVIAKYAGQNLTTGEQAKAYADNFIYVHMMKSTGGKSYAQMEKTDPARGTALTGDTLRGMLLNAYAFWKVGTYALLAGYVLLGLGALVLVTVVVLDRLFAPRKAEDFAFSPNLATA